MADPQQPASPDNQSFKDQRDILREINAELGKQINHVKDASKAYSGLEGIARKLQNDEEAISKLSVKQLKDLKAKAQANLRDLKAAAEKLTYLYYCRGSSGVSKVKKIGTHSPIEQMRFMTLYSRVLSFIPIRGAFLRIES